jgi:hypothetical protein
VNDCLLYSSRNLRVKFNSKKSLHTANAKYSHLKSTFAAIVDEGLRFFFLFVRTKKVIFVECKSWKYTHCKLHNIHHCEDQLKWVGEESKSRVFQIKKWNVKNERLLQCDNFHPPYILNRGDDEILTSITRNVKWRMTEYFREKHTWEMNKT